MRWRPDFIRLLNHSTMLHIYSIQHSEAKIFQLISEIARKWISDRNPQFVPLLVAYDTQSAPFPNSFFSERMTKSCPILWWKGALKDPNLSSVSASKFCFDWLHLLKLVDTFTTKCAIVLAVQLQRNLFSVIRCYEARNVMSSVLKTVVVSHQRKLGQLQMTATAILRVTMNETNSNEW